MIGVLYLITAKYYSNKWSEITVCQN